MKEQMHVVTRLLFREQINIVMYAIMTVDLYG